MKGRLCSTFQALVQLEGFYRRKSNLREPLAQSGKHWVAVTAQFDGSLSSGRAAAAESAVSTQLGQSSLRHSHYIRYASLRGGGTASSTTSCGRGAALVRLHVLLPSWHQHCQLVALSESES